MTHAANYKISIIIPIHNRWELTAVCLDSLARTTKHRIETIIVDNGSTDESPEACPALGKKLFGDHFLYLRQKTNRNFAAACNIGARAASSELLFFLNNDTVLLDNWLPPLLDALDSPPYPTAVGPMLLYPYFAGKADRVQHLGLAFEPQFYPAHLYEGFPADHPVCLKTRHCQALTGAALLLPRQLFSEIGGFDESFINGGEDIALGISLTAQKHILTVVPLSRIYHLASQTPGIHAHSKHNARVLKEKYFRFMHPDLHFFAEKDGYTIAFTPSLCAYLDLSIRRKALLEKQAAGSDSVETLEALIEHEPLCHSAYPKLALLYLQEGNAQEACNTLFLGLKMRPHHELARSLVSLAKATENNEALAYAASILHYHSTQNFYELRTRAEYMRDFMKKLKMDTVSALYAAWIDHKAA